MLDCRRRAVQTQYVKQLLDKLYGPTISSGMTPFDLAAPANRAAAEMDSFSTTDAYAGLVARQLELLGEDPDREGLVRTPDRVASAMAWLTRGYGLTPQDVVGDALFAEEHKSMVLVRDIE